jgi:tryptophan synthase alpha chain
MHALAAGGADVIELGVPFQRPDGRRPGDPEGQRARAGARHRLAQVLKMVRSSARSTTDTPVVLMGYANPVERYGAHGDRFVAAMRRAAGVDGVLVVDYPPEECEAFAAR